LPSQASAANKYLQSDGTNASWDAISINTGDITGTLAVANGGTGVTSSTGTGSVVLSNSPTLVTPALGAASASSLDVSGNVTLSGGTADTVPYLNGSKVLTSSTALYFNGTNLGVGGTSSYRLQVSSATFDDAEVGIKITRGGDSNSWTLVDNVGGSGNYRHFNTGTPTARWLTTTNGTSFTEQMRLNPTGLGIKNNNPAAALDVTGSALVSGSVTAASFSGALNGTVGATTASTGAFTTLSATGNVTLGDASTDTLNVGNGGLVKDASGNVGIGTSSPNAKLVVGTSNTVIVPVTASFDGVTPSVNSGKGILQLGSTDAVAVDKGGVLTFTANTTTQNGFTMAGIAGKAEATGAGVYSGYLQFITTNAAGGVAEKMRLDSSGNLGLGVTPSAWGSGYKSIDLNTFGGWTSTTSAMDLVANGYFNGTNWIAKTTAASSRYVQTSGAHTWKTAASVTAGSTLSYSDLMTLNSSGNLGLGVTPSAWGGGFKAFELVGGSVVSGASTNLVIMQNAYYDGSNYLYKTTSTAARYIQASGQHQFFTAPSGTAGNAITFTQAMTLDASGNLNVGTTSSIGSSRATFSNSLSGQSAISLQSTSTSGYSAANFYDNTGAIQTGAVGYGNASAAVSGAASNVYLYSTSAITFLSGGTTERARIDSSGNLLVGTTSNTSTAIQRNTDTASATISISSNTATTANQYGIYNRLVGDPNNTTNYFMSCVGNATTRMVVYSNGNIQNTNNSYGAISDVKLKENIVDASPKLADLMQVQVRNYNLIGDTTKQLGVVAQELESVFPSMVDVSPDKDAEGNDLGTTTKSVKYSVFVPMLIKAIQELKAEFDAYKASHP
jgi:hypothetical protein